MSEIDIAERLDEFLIAHLEEIDPDTGQTRGEVIIQAIVKLAMGGDPDAAKVIWARVDAAERRESWK